MKKELRGKMIFENAQVITMDPQRRIIEDGAVAVQGDRITDVGRRVDLLSRYPEDERFDAGGGIILPGLIDCHVHLTQALIRGCADDKDLMGWLPLVWQCLANFSAQDGKVSAELCILEMLKSGTTAFIETLLISRYGFDGIAKTVKDSGIRASLSKVIMGLSEQEAKVSAMPIGLREEKESTIIEAVKMHEKWEGAADGRIHVWLGPRPPGRGSTPEVLKEVARLSESKDMRINMHFCEFKERVDYYRKQFHCCPTEALQQMGLLNPRMLLIHAIWLDQEDISNIAQARTHVVHNPAGNMKLAQGFAKIPAMLAAGVNVSLGCDGGPSNNTYDMFRELKFASYIHKGRLLDPITMDSETVLEMATINGAKAMGLEKEIGSLEVGKKADLIVLDTNKAHLTPNPNPVSTCVCAVNGSDVNTVVIDGKMIMENRKVLTLDEEGIIKRARVSARDVFQRAGVKINSRWPQE